MKNRYFFVLALLFLIFANATAQSDNSYYFARTVEYSFDETVTKVREALKEQKFGIISEIDMEEKLAEKLDHIDMKKYKILGACNPGFAYQAIQIEENIGLFLPCKVLVKEINETTTEVVMVNPAYLMEMLGNEELEGIADEVTHHFKEALKAL